ncbi:hypothetical protein HZC30_00460 [Candidatus Woesearchaeota archaeon]|nr:hypothetical protein [Candidatus Woesearchaeota archaeon]
MALRSKKAQMHITETIGVLFIFFILVAFGLIFYYKYTEQAIEQEHYQQIDDRAVKLALEVFTLPELACTRGDAELEDYCVDMAKVRHLNETFDIHVKDYYFKLFGYAKIRVVQLYPPDGQNYTLYDKKMPLNETSTPDLGVTWFVVALKDEVTDMEKTPYSFGYIEVGVYSLPWE